MLKFSHSILPQSGSTTGRRYGIVNVLRRVSAVLVCTALLLGSAAARKPRRGKNARQKKSCGAFSFSSDQSHNNPSVPGGLISHDRPFIQYSPS